MLPLTTPQLRKKLRELDQKELIELIAQNYKVNPTLKVSLSQNFLEDKTCSAEICEKYQEKLTKVFDQFSVSWKNKEINAVLSEYRQTCPPNEFLIYFEMFYLDIALAWLQDISPYLLLSSLPKTFITDLSRIFDRLTQQLIEEDELGLFLNVLSDLTRFLHIADRFEPALVQNFSTNCNKLITHFGVDPKDY